MRLIITSWQNTYNGQQRYRHDIGCHGTHPGSHTRLPTNAGRRILAGTAPHEHTAHSMLYRDGRLQPRHRNNRSKRLDRFRDMRGDAHRVHVSGHALHRHVCHIRRPTQGKRQVAHIKRTVDNPLWHSHSICSQPWRLAHRGSDMGWRGGIYGTAGILLHPLQEMLRRGSPDVGEKLRRGYARQPAPCTQLFPRRAHCGRERIAVRNITPWRVLV